MLDVWQKLNTLIRRLELAVTSYGEECRFLLLFFFCCCFFMCFFFLLLLLFFLTRNMFLYKILRTVDPLELQNKSKIENTLLSLNEPVYDEYWRKICSNPNPLNFWVEVIYERIIPKGSTENRSTGRHFMAFTQALTKNQRMTKPTVSVWSAKTQISMHIHPVWQGFSLIHLW